MKYFYSNNRDIKLLGILLKPSWLSGLMSVVCGLVITVGSIVVSNLQGSILQQTLFYYHTHQYAQSNIYYSYQSVSSSLSANTLIGDLPLLLFWGLLGAIIYMFATGVLRAFQNTIQIEKELHYVHADRNKLMQTALYHLTIRALVVVLWFPFLLFFFHQLLPYSIAAAHIAAINLISFSGLAYASLSLALIILGVHVSTVLLRLLFLKPRLFSLYTG